MLHEMWETRGTILPPHAFHWQTKAALGLVDCNSYCILTCTSGLGSCQKQHFRFVNTQMFALREVESVCHRSLACSLNLPWTLESQVTLSCERRASHISRSFITFTSRHDRNIHALLMCLWRLFCIYQAKNKVQGIKNCNEHLLPFKNSHVLVCR